MQKDLPQSSSQYFTATC